jgi:hypothetical protein
LASAITWNYPSGVALPFSHWPDDLKAELNDAYDAIVQAVNDDVPYTGLPEAPALAVALNPADFPTTRLDEQLARRFFMGYVAQSLAAEKEEWVAWSMSLYDSEQLEWLLNSRSLFRWEDSTSSYSIRFATHGTATPGDPLRTYLFLETNGLIAESQRQTAERLIEWCRDNLVHYSGGPTSQNMAYHWQYEAMPPVERMISGTDRGDGYGVRHWTAGCWGTTGFLRAVSRTVNIPVTLEPRGGHALPHFLPEEDLYLSHGDDPYNRMSKSVPRFSGADLLIEQAQFDAWFGYGVPSAEVSNNVGRQVRELAIQYLPLYLLSMRCRDLAAGASEENSEIYDYFSRNYTVADLEAMHLWERMDEKIASLGGCQNIP